MRRGHYSWVLWTSPHIPCRPKNVAHARSVLAARKLWVASPRVSTRLRSEQPITSSFSDEKRHIVRSSHLGLKRSERSVSVLPIEVVQRIASGEVIPDFTSVVQELVENAIDASATSISVYIDLRSCSVTVKDDGAGISAPHDLQLVARCNATNKLASLNELDAGVPSLGFRGQGMWAIAAKAKALVVASRTADAPYGTSVTFSAKGVPVRGSITVVPMATGTTVSVHRLPWSFTGREKSAVLRKTKLWLVRAALCHPSVSFQLTRDGTMIWQRSFQRGTPEMLVKLTMAKELKVTPKVFRCGSRRVADRGSVHVTVGIPSAIHTSSKVWFITAINGRRVNCESVYRALAPVLSVPRGRFPVVYVAINISPGLVDWNISPLKTNFRFKDPETEQKVVDAVSQAVYDILEKITDPVAFPASGTVQTLLSSVSTTIRDQAAELGDRPNSMEKLTETAALRKLGRNARVVAQVLCTYILIERDDGIVLVEQHVAHERVLYEALLRDWKTSTFVKLETPLQLPDSVSDDVIFKLTSLGFNVENPIGSSSNDESKYMIRAIPAALSTMPSTQIVIMLLKLGSDATTIERAAASVACNIAIRNGMTLSHARMTQLVAELMDCQNPHTCPHGRPIFVEMSTSALARSFGRSWSPERVYEAQPGRRTHEIRGLSNYRKGILPE